MKAEDLLKDLAEVLFEPEIGIALQFYNAKHHQSRPNTVAMDMLRKRAVLFKAYVQYKSRSITHKEACK